MSSVRRDWVMPARRKDADELSVAQHRDAAGDLEHLREAMADEDDRDPLRAKRADDVEELFRLRLGERGSRLVHEDDASLAHQSAGDGHDLALRDREGAEPGVDVEVDTETLQDADRDRTHRRMIDQTRHRAKHGLGWRCSRRPSFRERGRDPAR